MTCKHLPMLTYKNNNEEFTLYFTNESEDVINNWKINKVNEIKFYRTF